MAVGRAVDYARSLPTARPCRRLLVSWRVMEGRVRFERRRIRCERYASLECEGRRSEDRFRCLVTGFSGRICPAGSSMRFVGTSSKTTRTLTTHKRSGRYTERVLETSSFGKRGRRFATSGSTETVNHVSKSLTSSGRFEVTKGGSPIAGHRWNIFADSGVRRDCEQSSSRHSSSTANPVTRPISAPAERGGPAIPPHLRRTESD
ncbi:Cell division protein FtsK [Mycolicibacterium hippocampi]|uniref:Cell division protein FtsK n=1 Tax=Mycolicibacterium hippocampi TaxID=659824 RepID=A0A850PNT8_9MYCO|nr:Cell division protein FtsK [Mycolicibacterium hippocampi]